MINPFRSLKSPPPAAPVDAAVQQLKLKLGEELGLESGFNDFPPEQVAALTAAEVRQLAEARFGAVHTLPEQFQARAAELRQQLQEVEAEQRAFQQRFSVRPTRRAVEGATASLRRWTTWVSVAVPVALLGLARDSSRGGLGWRGWLALALLAALLLAQLPLLLKTARRLASLPAWLVYGWYCYQEYGNYRQLRARAAELATQLEQNRQQQEAEAERRRQAEVWVAQHCELIMSHFGYHQTKGAVAARLAQQ